MLEGKEQYPNVPLTELDKAFDDGQCDYLTGGKHEYDNPKLTAAYNLGRKWEATRYDYGES